MPLTSKQLAAVGQWFSDKKIDLVCSFCKNTGFPAELTALLPYTGAELKGTGTVMLQMECQNCGHTILFNAKKMGVV